MEEIRAIPWNGLNAVSTFSGCGGSSLGYRMAGYRVLWASEFIPAAQETYRANAAPYTILDTRDIRDVQPEDILKATNLRLGELDLFDGSPPCASFSTSGSKDKHWGQIKKYSDTKQRTDDLFYEYVRLVQGIQPKTFIAENVSGLIKGTAKGYFKEIMTALKGCGYNVQAALLNAQWLGVPQARQRLIFIGVRKDLNLPPQFPKPLPYYYTLNDALTGHEDTNTDPETGTDVTFNRYAIYKEWKTLKIGETHEKRINLIRGHPNRPCPTITTKGHPGSAMVTHPDGPRKFTLKELRSICGFPQDFTLTGTYEKRWERLGRAVPPVMMSHIASTTRERILDRL